MESWRITGSNFIHVSKSGTDAGGTTGTITDPFLTVAAAVTEAESRFGTSGRSHTIVIGGGYYQESILFQESAVNRYNFVADGRVVMTGLSTGGMIFIGSVSTNISMNGIEFENIGVFSLSNSSFEMSDCILRNCHCSASLSFSRCVFINSSISSLGTFLVTKCTFHGSSLGVNNSDSSCSIISDCHFDATSRIIRLDLSRSGLMDHNNYDFTGGTTVEIKDGSYTTYTTLASLQSAVSFWNRNSLDSTPGFNGIGPEDVSLNSSSPLAYAGADGKHIGAYDIAKPEGTLSGQAFSDTATGFNYNPAEVELVGNGWALRPNVDESTITSGFIDLDVNQTVGRIRMYATQFAPSDVVDYDNTADNPNRQTYMLRWGPDSSNLSNWYLMEWNTIPTVNLGTGGVTPIMGNGHPDFDPNTAVRIQAKVLQLEIIIRRNGMEG